MICPILPTQERQSYQPSDCFQERYAWWRPPVGAGEGACAVVAISEDLESLLGVLKGVVAAFLAQGQRP